jgi:hypothetical protein
MAVLALQPFLLSLLLMCNVLPPSMICSQKHAVRSQREMPSSCAPVSYLKLYLLGGELMNCNVYDGDDASGWTRTTQQPMVERPNHEVYSYDVL